MTRNDCVEILNAANEGRPTNKLMMAISEYIAESKPQQVNKMIEFLNANPHFINMIFPQVMEYYQKKFNIVSIIQNNRILLYY